MKKVVYILGEGRSGSTLLADKLDKSSNVYNGGEIYSFPVRYRDNFSCGCGTKFLQCEFWNTIIQKLEVNGHTNLKELCEELYSIKCKLEDGRNIMKFVSGGVDKILNANEVNLYKNFYADLYKVIYEITCVDTIVDGSKNVLHYYLTHEAATSEAVYLVRDPRGVAYSWYNEKKRTDNDGENPTMPKFSILHSVIRIRLNDYLAGRLLKGEESVAICYEDYCSDQEKYLAFFKTKFDLQLSDKETDRKKHTIGGNPIRMNKVNIVKVDLRWKENLTSLQKVIIYLLTLPVIKKHKEISNSWKK